MGEKSHCKMLLARHSFFNFPLKICNFSSVLLVEWDIFSHVIMNQIYLSLRQVLLYFDSETICYYTAYIGDQSQVTNLPMVFLLYKSGP